MKKIYLFAALLFTAFCVKAQYFQQVYGTSVDDRLTSGINTFVQGKGHFMAGNNPGFNFGVPSISASFADGTGNVPAAPYFDNDYALRNISTGALINAYDPQVFEMNSGSGFGIVGYFQDPTITSNPNSGVYYMQLNAAGVPGAVYSYTVNTSGTNYWDVIHLAAITESSTGKELYITGWAQPNYAQVNSFILKIDIATGAILWGYVFDVVNPVFSSKDLSHDVIESPYSSDVLIVGQTYNSSPGPGQTSDGFLIFVNAANGTPNATVNIYGTSTSWDIFNSITVANSTTGGSNGFVIGGSSDVNGSSDFWLLKVDAAGNPIWSTLHDYSINPNAYDECMDVIERLNTAGKYEYYAGGTTYNGALGGTDVLVIKTDAKGNGVANGEFTYGAGGNDYGKSLDQYNGTGIDGLSVFGTFDKNVIGKTDLYLVKAYFNGLSGCNEKINTPNPSTGPGLYTTYSINQLVKFKGSKLKWKYATAKDANLCFNWSISGGSNARIAMPNNSTGIVASPNPMEAGNPLVNVTFESETETPATIQLYDMLGRTYYNQTTVLTKGTNKLPLDVSNANLAPGMYTLRISSNATNNTVLLLVK